MLGTERVFLFVQMVWKLFMNLQASFSDENSVQKCTYSVRVMWKKLVKFTALWDRYIFILRDQLLWKSAVYNFEYNKSFVCVCQNHIHVFTTMVAASIYAFHHGRKDVLWCSVCVRQVINPCRLDSVCVSNIVLHYDYMTNL